jgi:hypothetical protein
MNPKSLSVFGLFIGLAALMPGCSRENKEAAKETPSEKQEESRVKRAPNGEVTIMVDAETQKIMELQTADLTATQMNSEIKAYGHVLDTTPLGGLINELDSAQVAAENSRQELERMKVLITQKNTSERAFKAAEAAYARDQLSAKAVLLKVQTTWGKKLSELVASSTPLKAESNAQVTIANRLSSLDSVIVRIDLPSGQAVDSPKEARLLTPEANAKPIPAQFLDFAPSTDTQIQARGLFFITDNDGKKLIPGMAVTALIDSGQNPEKGVVVPRAAVVRAKGGAWVFLQTAANEFTRKETTTEHPVESGWYVVGLFKEGDKIVTVGAQQLLSEELKGQTGE